MIQEFDRVGMCRQIDDFVLRYGIREVLAAVAASVERNKAIDDDLILRRKRHDEYRRNFELFTDKLSAYGPDNQEVKELGQLVARAMKIDNSMGINMEIVDLADEIVDALAKKRRQSLTDMQRRQVLARVGLLVK